MEEPIGGGCSTVNVWKRLDESPPDMIAESGRPPIEGEDPSTGEEFENSIRIMASFAVRVLGVPLSAKGADQRGVRFTENRATHIAPSVLERVLKAKEVAGEGSSIGLWKAASSRCCTKTRRRLSVEVSVEKQAGRQEGQRTRVIPSDRRLHDLLHPRPNRNLLRRTEKVGAVRVVNDLEAKLSRVDVGIGQDAVAGKVDEALDFLLLKKASGKGSAAVRKREGRRRDDSRSPT